jgi:iron(III) transport system permease protein
VPAIAETPFAARFSAPLVAGLLAVPALVPLLASLFAWTTPAGEVWAHQLEHVLPRVVLNTTLLVALVAGMSAVLGASLAWLIAGCEFPGRRWFAWALLLPLAVPGYVLAVVYAGALDYAGPLQTALRGLFGAGLVLPPVRSLGGAALVLALTLFPYVYLLGRVAFEDYGARAIEAAQSLGLSRSQAVRRCLLPMARPAIAAGVALVAMETIADFGVAAAFNVDTFTTAIYRTWFGLYSLESALQMASLLALVALAAVLIERRLRRSSSYATGGAARPLPRLRLRGWQAWSATVYAGAVLAAGFVLPVAQLGSWAIRHAAGDFDARYLGFTLRSLALAGSGALVIVGAALLLGYALRRERRAWVHGLGRVATVGYALPGTVLAVGIVVPIALLDGQLQGLLDGLLGADAPRLFLQGTIAAMLLAYLARFLAVGAGPVESGLARIDLSLDDAAAGLGVRGVARFRRVHLPLLRGSTLAALALVFVDLMKELPITLMTRPFGFETLAVRVFEMAAEGEWQRAALPAVWIVLAGLVPVALLARRTGVALAQ